MTIDCRRLITDKGAASLIRFGGRNYFDDDGDKDKVIRNRFVPVACNARTVVLRDRSALTCNILNLIYLQLTPASVFFNQCEMSMEMVGKLLHHSTRLKNPEQKKYTLPNLIATRQQTPQSTMYPSIAKKEHVPFSRMNN